MRTDQTRSNQIKPEQSKASRLVSLLFSFLWYCSVTAPRDGEEETILGECRAQREHGTTTTTTTTNTTVFVCVRWPLSRSSKAHPPTCWAYDVSERLNWHNTGCRWREASIKPREKKEMSTSSIGSIPQKLFFLTYRSHVQTQAWSSSNLLFYWSIVVVLRRPFALCSPIHSWDAACLDAEPLQEKCLSWRLFCLVVPRILNSLVRWLAAASLHLSYVCCVLSEFDGAAVVLMECWREISDERRKRAGGAVSSGSVRHVTTSYDVISRVAYALRWRSGEELLSRHNLVRKSSEHQNWAVERWTARFVSWWRARANSKMIIKMRSQIKSNRSTSR